MMVIDMKVIGEMINKKEEEYIILIMDLLKVIDMKVNGKMENRKEKEYIFIIMVIDLKVSLETINKKEKEFIIFIMVIDEWAIFTIIKNLLKVIYLKVILERYS